MRVPDRAGDLGAQSEGKGQRVIVIDVIPAGAQRQLTAGPASALRRLFEAGAQFARVALVAVDVRDRRAGTKCWSARSWRSIPQTGKTG